MAILTKLIQSIIDDINTAIKFATPLASGNPIEANNSCPG